ncbi:hypothetical protein ACFX10_001810 [Malus domestica]
MPSIRASGLLSLMRRRRTGKPSRPLTLALSPNKGKIVCFVSLSVPPDPQETFDPAPSPPNLRANPLPQGPKPPGQSFSGFSASAAHKPHTHHHGCSYYCDQHHRLFGCTWCCDQHRPPLLWWRRIWLGSCIQPLTPSTYHFLYVRHDLWLGFSWCSDQHHRLLCWRRRNGRFGSDLSLRASVTHCNGEKEKRLCFRSISPKTLSLFLDFWFSSPLEVGTTTMNATAPPDVIQITDYQNGSDSDTNIDDDDDAPTAKFYQPVSAIDSEDDEDQIENDTVPIQHLAIN